jgi:hypothetical protein
MIIGRGYVITSGYGSEDQMGRLRLGEIAIQEFL